MRPPSPGTCFYTVVTIGGGLAVWDGTCYILKRDLPPSQLHQLAVGFVVMAGVVGALGYWFEHLVALGSDMERARRGDRPAPRNGQQVQTHGNVHQLRKHRPEQLTRRAE